MSDSPRDLDASPHSDPADVLADYEPDRGDEDTCQPSVDETDSFYRRFEAPDEDNSCGSHGDCLVGGCSGEICAAVAMGSTCEGLPVHPLGECGCADGECIWYLGDCSP